MIQVRGHSWLKEVDVRGCKGMQALSIDDGKVGKTWPNASHVRQAIDRPYL